MSVQDVLEITNVLSREDKTVLFTRLGEQLAADFTGIADALKRFHGRTLDKNQSTDCIPSVFSIGKPANAIKRDHSLFIFRGKILRQIPPGGLHLLCNYPHLYQTADFFPAFQPN